MNPEERDLLFSQLVDGELHVDEANRVLGEVLDELADGGDDGKVCRRLKAMLQTRQALAPWRQQEPPPAIVALQPLSAMSARHHFARWTSLVAAALLGGVLVAGGYYLGGQRGAPSTSGPLAGRATTILTADERQEIARAFSLHESVLGPLSWYAVDDETIQVAPARDGDSLPRPIAVVLQFTREQPSSSRETALPKTYVIVCRDRDAAVELPPSLMANRLRLRLLAKESDGQVNLQYFLVADDADCAVEDAALVGRRRVGAGQTSLGQLALNDCLVNVDASAWVLGNGAQ
jgi:hypothetical protein